MELRCRARLHDRCLFTPSSMRKRREEDKAPAKASVDNVALNCNFRFQDMKIIGKIGLFNIKALLTQI